MQRKTFYYQTINGGDGSATAEFFSTRGKAEEYTQKELDSGGEIFTEGPYSFTVTIDEDGEISIKGIDPIHHSDDEE